MKSKKKEETDIYDAIDELIEQERMAFEENVKLMLSDIRKELGVDLRYARRKISDLEKRMTKRLRKKSE